MSIKNILFLTDNFPPEVNAPATRTYEHAKSWANAGYNITILTCAPNFPRGIIYEGYQNRLFSRERLHGLTVIRVWTYITPNEGFFRRTVDYISFAVSSFIAGIFIKTDIIIATSPQFFTAISGRSLSFVKRTPWIMEVRDLWPETIVAVGAMKKGVMYNILERIELALYRSARDIIVVTDTFKKDLTSRKIAASKIHVYKNGVDPRNYVDAERDVTLLKTMPFLQDKKVISYIGTLGMAHALSFILDCLPTIKKLLPNVHFLIIGDGAERENLIGQSCRLKLTNVTFLPSVSKSEIVRYWSITDIALVNLKKCNTFRGVIPSKIFEAASLQKPILLGLLGETKIMIERYNAGLCFQPEDKYDFIKQCEAIIYNGKYSQYQLGCKSLADSHDRRTIASDIICMITQSH